MVLCVPAYSATVNAAVNGSAAPGWATAMSWLYLLYALAVFIPSLAVVARRMHDIGKSGWNYLMILIPIAGPFIVLAYFCKDSEAGDNQYGPNPKMKG